MRYYAARTRVRLLPRALHDPRFDSCGADCTRHQIAVAASRHPDWRRCEGGADLPACPLSGGSLARLLPRRLLRPTLFWRLRLRICVRWPRVSIDRSRITRPSPH